MAVEKVAYDGHALIDLTGDTAVEADVASGKTFHKADGTQAVGIASGGGGTVNLQNKTVNLGSSSPPAVSADEGYDGLGQVSFNVSGISANKIKNGESICGVNGTYNPAANFTRHLNLTFNTVDGTTLADVDIVYRGADTTTPQNVVWKSASASQVFDPEDPSCFDYEVSVDMVAGSGSSGADGLYVIVGGGCTLHETQNETVTFIERSNNADIFYVIFPTSSNAPSLDLAIGSYTPPGPHFGRTISLSVTLDDALRLEMNDIVEVKYRGYINANTIGWKTMLYTFSSGHLTDTHWLSLCTEDSAFESEEEGDGLYIQVSSYAQTISSSHLTYRYAITPEDGGDYSYDYYTIDGSSASIIYNYN